MRGAIKDLLKSDDIADKNVVNDVFSPDYQSWEDWKMRLHHMLLGGSVASQFAAPANCWNVYTFQALYIACWIHHPVEKGTYMISLTGLSQDKVAIVKAAIKKHLTSRKSSHLSGKGYSASKRWDFLKGYDELLIQLEGDYWGQPFLLLKCEGHTTGISGVVPHIQSWNHKRKHGVGLEASPDLHALAMNAPNLVMERAAENYDKHYEKLLKVLDFHGRMVNVRQMFIRLCRKTGWATGVSGSARSIEVGKALRHYCSDAVQPTGARYRMNGQITDGMLATLRTIAITLINEHTSRTSAGRVFQEIRVTPAELDTSLANFRLP